MPLQTASRTHQVAFNTGAYYSRHGQRIAVWLRKTEAGYVDLCCLVDFDRQICCHFPARLTSAGHAVLARAREVLGLYEQMYRHLKPQAPVPDLVIYLQAEPATLGERVRRRGISHEQPISEAYLLRLAERYTRFFHHYDAAPLLIVNADHFNFVDSDDDFALLLRHIGALRGRREYLNRAS